MTVTVKPKQERAKKSEPQTLQRSPSSRARLLELIGDPHRLDAQLEQFRTDAKFASSIRADLLQKYPKRWVAVFQGAVRADEASLEELLAKTDALGLPRGSIFVTFIDPHPRKMIL